MATMEKEPVVLKYAIKEVVLKLVDLVGGGSDVSKLALELLQRAMLSPQYQRRRVTRHVVAGAIVLALNYNGKPCCFTRLSHLLSTPIHKIFYQCSKLDATPAFNLPSAVTVSNRILHITNMLPALLDQYSFQPDALRYYLLNAKFEEIYRLADTTATLAIGVTLTHPRNLDAVAVACLIVGLEGEQHIEMPLIREFAKVLGLQLHCLPTHILQRYYEVSRLTVNWKGLDKSYSNKRKIGVELRRDNAAHLSLIVESPETWVTGGWGKGPATVAALRSLETIFEDDPNTVQLDMNSTGSDNDDGDGDDHDHEIINTHFYHQNEAPQQYPSPDSSIGEISLAAKRRRIQEDFGKDEDYHNEDYGDEDSQEEELT